ncbi:MAG: methyltransferase domain-containing protein [Rubrobacter sp.]
MFRRSLLPLVRPRPSDEPGLVYDEGVEEGGVVLSGTTRLPATGETYPVKNGYLDLLKGHLGGDNVANLTNFLPGAGRGYEPLWRVRSLNLLTGEDFPNWRELGIIAEKVGLQRGGLYLDLGCSAGLYTRNLARTLGNSGDVIGVDISPSMLKEASRLSRKEGVAPSLVRADAASLPFADACMNGAVCGGTLNELGDPARVLRETHRVLQPGSRFAVMGILEAQTPNGRLLQRFLSTGGIQFFAPEELGGMLDAAGFEPDPLVTHGAVFFAAGTRR